MSTPNMDPAAYFSQLSAESQGGEGFGASLRQTAMAAAPTQRALAAVTPSRAALAGWAGLAVAAGNTQEQLSSLAAQATVTHARMGQLTTGINSLARSYGIGNSGARELYSQLSRLGTVSAGLEGNVSRLGKAFTVLSGATGEGSGGLASGFIILNRSMSTGFDAARMGKLADSLTTVAAKSGASATGILQFSKSIAPLAQASGIGETKVLGISAAFNKLGDDGVGAATAFNKMLGDMNRSIRDGSPMLTTYAQIVGKTTSQFASMVKSNPAEAITQVTEALGKPGGNSPRQLEMLGLDGVRTQRYLQELSQSGGLRQSINTSVSAYGSGSTQEAARKAFGTFADSTQRAAANAQQLGEAFGQPLLGPLTKFTDAMGAAVTPLRVVAQSGLGQKVLELGASLLVVSKIVRPLMTATMIGGAATSGPVRSFFGGMANARGAMNGVQGPGSRLWRMGGGVSPLVASGADIGHGAMVPVNAGFSRFGSLVGTALTPVLGGAEGPGVLAQMRGLGMGGLAAYNRGTSEALRNARLPAEERSMRIMPRAGFLTGGRANGAVFDSAHEAMVRNEAMQRQGLITPGEQMQANMREFGRVRQTMAQMSFGQQLGMNVRAGAAPYGQLGLSAGKGLLNVLGGPTGIALAGGTVLGTMAYRGHQQQQEQYSTARTSTGLLDDYRVAMGKATQATSTFAGKMSATADELTSNVTSMSQALTVGGATMRAASMREGKQVTTFSGSERSIAAGLRTQIAGGATPDEVNRMVQDLAQQYGQSKAGRIAGQLQGYSGDLTSDVSGDLRTAAKGSASTGSIGGPRRFLSRYVLGNPKENANTSGFLDVNTTSKAQQGAIKSMVADIEQRRQQRTDAYGEGFANSRARKEIDSAVQGAIDSGNESYLYHLQNQIQGKYHLRNQRISAGDVRKAGGFSAYEATHNLDRDATQSFRETIGNAPSRAEVQRGQNLMSNQLVGNQLRGAFMGSAVQGLIGPNGQPESPQAQAQALAAVMNSAGKGSDGLLKLAQASLDAANTFGDTTDAGKLAIAAFNKASQQLGALAPFQTSGAAAMGQARLGAIAASTSPQNDTTGQIREGGQQQMQQAQAAAVQAAQQRLTQIREYQVSMARAAADFRRQQTYADDDFKRGRERAEEDYGITVARTQRNYLIQMADAEADYQRQRRIAYRDFAKQQTRAAEDAAKSMYDPYQRIAAKGVWDPRNLSQNLGEQAKAMSGQLGNLKTVRGAGLSNQAITLLGLNDPANAQQLASAVGTLMNDPKLVATLNNQAKQRQTLAGALLGDPSNAAFARQKADFATQMGDAATAYATSVRRAARNLHTQLGDMASDQARSLARSLTDYQIGLGRMADANAVMILRAGQDLARSQQVIVGSLDQLTDALAKGTKIKVDTWTGLLKDGMKDWTAVLKAFQDGDWKALTAALGLPGISIAAGGPAAHHDPDVAKHARGAIFSHPVFSGRDEMGEAGPEMVLPLDTRGANFLALTMARVGTQLDARSASGAAHTTVINNNQTITYDSSVRPERVEVRADDAAALGEQLRRQAAIERGKRPAALR